MKKFVTPLLFCVLALSTACSHHKKDKKKPEAQTSYSTPVSQEGLDKMTETWPESSKTAIKNLTSKYGLPDAVTEEMVVWNNSGPFKRSIVTKDEVNHQFPMQQSEVLVQSVDYRVPLDKIQDVSKFDGSLFIDRTKGELSSRSSREELNILALNLADKIVRGDMSVEQARREYAKDAQAFAAGSTSNMLTTLNFTSQGNTGDPDTSIQAQESTPTQIKKTKTKKVEEVIEDQP